LLQVPDGRRVSALERLRQSPRRSSGPEMVKALRRAEQIAVLGASLVGVDDIPANRLQVLARSGLGSRASALARLGEPKRTATLVAVLRHLEAVAVDDTLDLFALLMATRLFSPARRASGDQRLAMPPRPEKASKTIARAGRVLLDALAAAENAGERLEVAALWSAVERVVALLGESTALHAAPGGERVLAAVRALPELARRRVTQKPLADDEIDAELVTPAWRRAVYASPGLPPGRWTATRTWCACSSSCTGRWAAATCMPGPRTAGPTRGRCCWPASGGMRYARTCWPGSASPIPRRRTWRGC